MQSCLLTMDTHLIFQIMSPEGAPEDNKTLRNVEDVFSEIKTHLTKEELLCFSLYKNAKRQRNQIHKVFLETHFPEKYRSKKLSSSAITKRKTRLMHVLGHVGAMLRFKRSTNVDHKIKQVLTQKQYIMLILYERRVPMKEIAEKLEMAKWVEGSPGTRSISNRFYAAINRLQETDDPEIRRYLELLGNVLKFSRKYPTSKR